MNLYLKYRPRTIDELDLSGVRKTLTDMVKANNVAHAYLLTGPRGSGKTSAARVMARIVNCEKNGKTLGEPCNKCGACQSILEGSSVDVIEIDAASNRGIDDIRDLKEKIRLAPAILPKKVYIIDEVHMLTTEAFNALLKTLEEPPSHSLFILCTTELHKVPETIVSRCVQIQFTRATVAEMQRSLTRVVAGEEKKVSEEALLYLATSVDGSFRDGVKILDQVLSNSDSVGIAEIELVVSGSAGYMVEPLLSALTARDVGGALAKLDEAVGGGVDLSYLLVSVMRGLRDKLLAGSVGLEVTKLIFALDEVARRLATTQDGELLIQVAIVEWCGCAPAENNQALNDNNQSKTSKKQTNTTKKEAITTDGGEVWKQLLGSLNGDSVTLGALLAKAGPARIQGDELTIVVRYGFHRDQIMTEKILAKLEKLVSGVMGRAMRVKCEVSMLGRESGTIAEAPKFEDDLVSQAQKIFVN